MRFEKIEKGIFLLKVPFEDLYTSVFAVKAGEEIALVDTATTEDDVTRCILPALDDLLAREGGTLRYILLTHSHGDHAGGAPMLAAHFQSVPVCTLQRMDFPLFRQLSDGEEIMGCLRVVHLPGHSPFSVGYYDTRSRVLLSGDCLQLRGVGKYTRGISDREAYVASVERLERMDIDCIVASHDYVPLGSTAKGKKAVSAYLYACKSICREQEKNVR